MREGRLEHINLTVSDPDRTAKMLVDLFGWSVRWSGQALGGGYTVHVGEDTHYVALYRPSMDPSLVGDSYSQRGCVNHVGVLVADLDAAEERVLQAGLTSHSHKTYKPGRRFYFHDHDGIEYEVVSYARP